MSNTHASGSSQSLRRTLHFKDLIAYGLAYIAPVVPLTTLGFVWGASGGLMAGAFLVGALCMYFTAQSYASMSEISPNAGSVYGFARFGLGPYAGFISGWMILLDYLLQPALIFTLMAVGMEVLIPGISRAQWICILVALSVVINWFGVRITTRLSVVSVILQFIAVAVVLWLCVRAIHGGAGLGALTHAPFFSGKATDFSNLAGGASIAVLAFLGFDAISTLSEEVRSDDRRMIGRATLVVLLISGSTFVLASWVLGNLLPGLEIHDPAAAIFEVLGQTSGEWAAIALAWFLPIVVGLPNVLPTQVGVARVLYAMGRDKQLPAALARLHPMHGTPYVAMLVSTGISLAIALALRDNVDLLASLVSFGALAGFTLLHLSVLVHHAEHGGAHWFKHKLVPVVGLVVMMAIFSSMQDIALQLGFTWLAIGFVYGAVLRRKGRMKLEV